MTINFLKMHGLGNDYIYVDCLDKPLDNASELAVRLSDRHFGIGADGLVLIQPSRTGDFRMEMYNRDGSRGLMCGNAIRCVGKYLYDSRHTAKKELVIETDSGLRHLKLHITGGYTEQVSVDMGKPVFDPGRIPVLWPQSQAIGIPVNAAGREYHLTCLSMGNPHAVLFTDDVENLDLPVLGPIFENHPLFPERVNTEFIRVLDRGNLRMRVWERGSGETMACGTGACAALVAAVVNDLCAREAVVHLNGGNLHISWPEAGSSVVMTGPATFVYSGKIEV